MCIRDSVLASAALACPGSAQSLLVPDSSNRRVMEFSALDGSLINPDFIDLTAGSGSTAITPIEALTVGDEIWVSDQISDILHVWSLDGSTYIGELGMGCDNPRGFTMASNGQIYLTNFNSSGAGFGSAIKQYQIDGTFVNDFPAGMPFDVYDTGTDLLSSNATTDTIDRYDYAGNSLGTFTNATFSACFPEQIASFGSDLVIAGFASGGIHVLDSATGNELAFFDTAALGFGSVRGVATLGNGDLLFTNNNGVHVYDISSNSVTSVMAGISARFISGEGSGDIGDNYCRSVPNSTGFSGQLSASGSPVASMNDFTLTGSQLPDGQFAYFLASRTQGFVPTPSNSTGNLCVLGSIARLNAPGQLGQTANGLFSLQVPLDDIPEPPGFNTTILAGETWNFQLWHRDFGAAGPTSNFTEALEVLFE